MQAFKYTEQKAMLKKIDPSHKRRSNIHVSLHTNLWSRELFHRHLHNLSVKWLVVTSKNYKRTTFSAAFLDDWYIKTTCTSSHLFLPKVASRVHGGKHLEAICRFDHLHLIISAISASLLRQQDRSLWLQHRVQSLKHGVISEGDFINEKHGPFFHGCDQRPINPLKQFGSLRVLLFEVEMLHHNNDKNDNDKEIYPQHTILLISSGWSIIWPYQ